MLVHPCLVTKTFRPVLWLFNEEPPRPGGGKFDLGCVTALPIQDANDMVPLINDHVGGP